MGILEIYLGYLWDKSKIVMWATCNRDMMGIRIEKRYLAEQFHQIAHYLAEQFHQIAHYFAEPLIQKKYILFLNAGM